jgi:uncharacterized membrane protein YqjE
MACQICEIFLAVIVLIEQEPQTVQSLILAVLTLHIPFLLLIT